MSTDASDARYLRRMTTGVMLPVMNFIPQAVPDTPAARLGAVLPESLDRHEV